MEQAGKGVPSLLTSRLPALGVADNNKRPLVLGAMSEKAQIILDGKTYEFPIVTGSEGEQAIDIGKLRDETGYITLDSGYKNTGATKSAITFLDGEKGILQYRGYPIDQLAEKASFLEVSTCCFSVTYRTNNNSKSSRETSVTTRWYTRT
jgi:hypothetical protein